MIYLRNDDVLIESTEWKDSLKRFKKVHRWICSAPDKVLHVPAILMHHDVKKQKRGLLGYPDGISFIKEETAEGRMRPEIHGYEHKDYSKVPLQQVVTELEICKDFLWCTLNTIATTWYTPWGANAPHLYEAASLANLKLVDCTNLNDLAGKTGVVQRFKMGILTPNDLEEKEIFYHWWSRGCRLQRALEVIKHGDWATAKSNNESWFDDTK